MEINLKNLDAEFERLKNQIDSETRKRVEMTSEVIATDLFMTTPVDTGLARNGWQVVMEKSKAIISNPVSYIEELNNGSSKQAPAHFIEKVALKYGKPLGAIINVK